MRGSFSSRNSGSRLRPSTTASSSTPKRRGRKERYTLLRYFCSPHHQDSALYPIGTQLERAAGFVREDTPGTRLDKLQALLAQASPSDEDIAFLAELLSIPSAERYAPQDLSPQRRKERTFEVLLRQFTLLARQQPVLMIFEDVHWIDPTSRELLDLTVARTPGLSVLLLISKRPLMAALLFE